MRRYLAPIRDEDFDIEDYFIEDLFAGWDHLLSSLAASDKPSLIFDFHSWGDSAFTTPSESYASPTNS